MTAVVLLLLFAAEGITILRIRALLSVHLLVGALLIPPVLLKMGSTIYRFARYYSGSPAYRRRGPPTRLLRVLGPVVVLSTVALFATGMALLFVNPQLRSQVLLLHRASFFLWFAAMSAHVLGHLVETARLAPRDWARRSRAEIAGARLRQWVVASSLVVGVPLGILAMGRAGSWFI